MKASSPTRSREGFQWTQEAGLQPGIPSLGVIEPPSNVQSTEHIYDVAVIGAGYAGLTAARDLTTAGHQVLLLEARDRIGGRTWSSDIDGYPYDLGGTWVHWNQPFIWRELSRYNMDTELEISPETGHGVDRYSLITPEGEEHMNHEKEAEVMESAMKKFINVDGHFGRKIIPYPHDPHYNPEVARYDKMSFGDRLAEIEHDLTLVERQTYEGFLTITSGGRLEESSFFEMLRWWALNNYDMRQFMDLCLTFKLRRGQSALARNLFDEAFSTRKLSYAFRSPVAQVHDRSSMVEVVCRDGRLFRARRLVCTVPLNVLNKVSFSPPLNRAKQEAAALGHVNHVSKVHVECANPELRTFSGIAYPHNKLTYIFGDGTTPAGNTHLVSFGNSMPDTHLQPEEDIQETILAFKKFAPMDVKQIVFHNWHKDEFAQGAWEWLRPGMATQYLDGLRERQGNILFASADWARGWRAFIDGAIEDGARTAMELIKELRREETFAPRL